VRSGFEVSAAQIISRKREQLGDQYDFLRWSFAHSFQMLVVGYFLTFLSQQTVSENVAKQEIAQNRPSGRPQKPSVAFNTQRRRLHSSKQFITE
jgi:hypothetical protein